MKVRTQTAIVGEVAIKGDTEINHGIANVEIDDHTIDVIVEVIAVGGKFVLISAKDAAILVIIKTSVGQAIKLFKTTESD